MHREMTSVQRGLLWLHMSAHSSRNLTSASASTRMSRSTELCLCHLSCLRNTFLWKQVKPCSVGPFSPLQDTTLGSGRWIQVCDLLPKGLVESRGKQTAASGGAVLQGCEFSSQKISRTRRDSLTVVSAKRILIANEERGRKLFVIIV